MFALGASGVVWAGLPGTLPANWILFDSDRCPLPASSCPDGGNFEIYAQDTNGGVYQITNSPGYDSWWPKLSPDRTKILFHRTDAGLKEIDGFSRTSLWVVDVATTMPPKKIIGAARGPAAPNAFGWTFLAHAEWSPLQNAITVLAVEPNALTTGIYVVPFGNSTNSVGAPYRVSFGSGANPRPGLNLDPSFTLDNNVLFIGCNDDPTHSSCKTLPNSTQLVNPQELVVTANSDANIGEVRLTTTADASANFDPYYNTDGGQIAWLHENTCNNWDIRHPIGDGTKVAEILNDGAVNSKPAWLNSNTLYLHRWPMIAPVTAAVNVGSGSAGFLEPGKDLNFNCQTDGPTSTSTPAGMSPDPMGLSADTVLLASNRTTTPGKGAANWKIYTWTLSSGAGTNPLPAGSLNDGYDYYQPRISPKRDRILYFRSPQGEKGNPYAQDLWVMNSDGSNATQLIASGDTGASLGWARISGANWSPAGDQIVLSAATQAQAANNSDQIYRVFYSSGTNSVSSVAKLSFGAGTADRPGVNAQPAYSPDGSRVVYTGCALNAARGYCLTTRSKRELITTSAIVPGGAGEIVLTTTTDGTVYSDPSYSPNGATIAAVHSVTCSSTQIVMLGASGGAVTTLLGNAIHFRPQWTFDGNSVIFAVLPADLRSIIYRIDANFPDPSVLQNGTNLLPVTAATPCSSEYPNAGR